MGKQDKPSAVVGMDVFVYDCTREGFNEAYVGKILTKPAVQHQAGKPYTVVNVITLNHRSSRYPPAYPIDNCTFCADDTELRACAAAGRKWVCKPYDPADPQHYQEPENKAPEKK